MSNKKNCEKVGVDIILTPETYTKVLLWLPGVGDVPDSYKDDFITDAIIPNNVKVILLSPPVKPFTLSENKSITNWFDVYKQGFHDTSYYNFEDAATSSNRIIKIIKNEAKKLKNNYSKFTLGAFLRELAWRCIWDWGQVLIWEVSLSVRDFYSLNWKLMKKIRI